MSSRSTILETRESLHGSGNGNNSFTLHCEFSWPDPVNSTRICSFCKFTLHCPCSVPHDPDDIYNLPESMPCMQQAQYSAQTPILQSAFQTRASQSASSVVRATHSA